MPHKRQMSEQEILAVTLARAVNQRYFGIVKPDGNRQFHTAFVEICKKVGKSELAVHFRGKQQCQ